ncbi:MAG: site-specific integrase [Chitinophagaceae bacterium]|nr:site-specific integrase [Chitinophagaceae bacterium]
METSLTISLDTRRAKKDGSYPLILRLGHKQRTTTIPLNLTIKEKDWDEKNKVVRKSFIGTDNPTRLNNSIQKRKSDAWNIILQLEETNQLQFLTVLEVKQKILGDDKNKAMNFGNFTLDEINRLKTANRFGTATSYRQLLNVLNTFSKKKHLRFEEITFSFLSKFEAHHFSKGNNANSLAVYMRTIRALYNKGIKAGVVAKNHYPFTDYKIKTRPTEKRALEWTLLTKIINEIIEPGDACFNARNYFVASYMMYGMNFKDMAYLKISNIKNGRLQYRRAKTSKVFDIKITSNLERIFTYYMNDSKEGYIFPIIKRIQLIDQEKDILWARKRYNKNLKKLAKRCGIETNLTSYVSRHSFATQAMLTDVPVNAISAMLGHSSIKTTEIYLKSLPSNILDDYNEKILDRLI